MYNVFKDLKSHLKIIIIKKEEIGATTSCQSKTLIHVSLKMIQPY